MAHRAGHLAPHLHAMGLPPGHFFLSWEVCCNDTFPVSLHRGVQRGIILAGEAGCQVPDGLFLPKEKHHVACGILHLR